MSLPDQSVTWMPCLYYFARFFSPIFLWFRNEDRKRDSIRPWRNICQLCISRIETWTTTGKMGRNLTYGKLWIGEERWKLSTLFSLWPTFFVTFCLFPGSGALQNGEQGVAIVHLGNLFSANISGSRSESCISGEANYRLPSIVCIHVFLRVFLTCLWPIGDYLQSFRFIRFWFRSGYWTVFGYWFGTGVAWQVVFLGFHLFALVFFSMFVGLGFN